MSNNTEIYYYYTNSNELLSHVVSVFAIKCSIIFGFLISLSFCCCCCGLFGSGKKNKKSKFSIIKYNELNELDVSEFNVINESKDSKNKSQTKTNTTIDNVRWYNKINIFKCCVKKRSDQLMQTNLTNKINNKDIESGCEENKDQVDNITETPNKDIEVIDGTQDIKQKQIYILYSFDNMNKSSKSTSTFLNPISQEENDEFDDLNCFVNILLETFKNKKFDTNSQNNQIHILLKILSPGGVAYKFEHAYLSLLRLKANGFKITALIDEIAASGGYMLASACDKIVCSKYATIGSVGVIAQVYNWSELGKKIGIEEKTFTTGSHKNIFPSGSAYTDTDVERMNESLNEVFEIFKDIVQTSRNLNETQLSEVLKAKTFHGFDAIKYNLVDEIKLSDEYISELINQPNFEKNNEIWTITKTEKDGSYIGSLFESSINNIINLGSKHLINLIEYKLNKHNNIKMC
jgi:signal peptide peptidase SppA